MDSEKQIKKLQDAVNTLQRQLALMDKKLRTESAKVASLQNDLAVIKNRMRDR